VVYDYELYQVDSYLHLNIPFAPIMSSLPNSSPLSFAKSERKKSGSESVRPKGVHDSSESNNPDTVGRRELLSHFVGKKKKTTTTKLNLKGLGKRIRVRRKKSNAGHWRKQTETANKKLNTSGHNVSNALTSPPSRREFIKKSAGAAVLATIGSKLAAEWWDFIRYHESIGASGVLYYYGYYLNGSGGCGVNQLTPRDIQHGWVSDFMQAQQESNWCFFAVAVSLKLHCDPNSCITQCELATWNKRLYDSEACSCCSEYAYEESYSNPGTPPPALIGCNAGYWQCLPISDLLNAADVGYTNYTSGIGARPGCDRSDLFPNSSNTFTGFNLPLMISLNIVNGATNPITHVFAHCAAITDCYLDQSSNECIWVEDPIFGGFEWKVSDFSLGKCDQFYTAGGGNLLVMITEYAEIVCS
jgi:hypothetical protein